MTDTVQVRIPEPGRVAILVLTHQSSATAEQDANDDGTVHEAAARLAFDHLLVALKEHTA